jgi:hypothetical protein
MKTLVPSRSARQRGILMLDLVAGLALLSIAIVPLGFAFHREYQTLRIEYYRSVVDELVDGELEILAAGAARNLSDGTQPLVMTSNAAAGLPASHFQLTKTGSHLRVEWIPDVKCGLNAIRREGNLK